MKKYFIKCSLPAFLLLLLFIKTTYAQENRKLIDSAFSSEIKKRGSAAVDIADYTVTDQYTDQKTGFTYTYVQQRYNNLRVYNAITVFLFKAGKLIYFKPGMVDDLIHKAEALQAKITPTDGIVYALKHLGKIQVPSIKPPKTGSTDNEFLYELPEFSATPVKVQLVYHLKDNRLYLAWDVSIELKDEPHWWNIRIDAVTGAFIDKNDFTSSCDFGGTALIGTEKLNSSINTISAKNEFPLVPSYNIFPFPIEAPTFGSRSVLTDPSDISSSPYGWHDVDGAAGNEYTTTRGNNVHAYEDANNDNLPGYSPNSSTLQFNFSFTSTATPLTNQDAAITNLFYVNNRVHDVLSHVGFDEAAGNFQFNNYGNGGMGFDQVKAEAFDGSGSNNANFSTPPDGIPGRMQMYLWSGTPQLDGCFDNGVIAHEYGHGVSNRLTGGPSQASCLTNAEQGGEGWSDWLALMMTIEPGDNGAMPRGIGTYVKGQTTTGAGIRRFRYSTNMSINPQTYANLATSSNVHQIGEIWCDAIWDMSWFLIDDLGYSNDPTVGTAGNNIAMRLVLEGMKLQPCSPGFLDARDAILLADAIFYNNAHRCRIWEAFARRGMGYNASQGLSTSSTDQVAGFAMPPFCLEATQAPVAAFTSDITTVSCGGTIRFTDQSTQAFSWHWNFGDQSTSTLQNPTHSFTSAGSYTVTLTVNNPLGSNAVSHTIIVNSTFNAGITATPSSVCSGSPVQLNAVASGSPYITYNVSNIPYAPLNGTATNVSLADDAMSTAKPIGFSFKFFGQNYTNFYICSNGYISFSAAQSTSAVYGSVIPSSGSPNNFIAVAWNDLYPQGISNAVSYFNTGTAPNRKLVVRFNTRHFGGTEYPFIAQAILSEGSNEIEIHTTTISNASLFDEAATTTQGVENINGTAGVSIPGRAGTIFSASNDAYKFTPLTPYTYNWLPGNLPGATQIVNPVTSIAYTVKIADGSGCVLSFNSEIVNVHPVQTLNFSGLPSNMCTTDPAVTLTASLVDGTFSGPGMITNSFDPGIAGVGTHTISFTDINGCNSISKQVTVSVCPAFTVFNLKLFLEGFYIGNGMMRPTKYDLGLTSDATVTDDITVDLWAVDNLGNTSPDFTIAAILHVDGMATLQFPGSVSNRYFYIAVRHRNSLETWSKLPVLISNNSLYDFSDQMEKAFADGINAPMHLIGGGKYAFYSGDVNQDGGIDAADLSEAFNDSNYLLLDTW